MTAGRNSAGSTTGVIPRKPSTIPKTGSPKGPEHAPNSPRGCKAHWRDTHLLPPAPGTSPASQIYPQAGTVERGDQASHPSGWDLPPDRLLSTPDPGPVSRPMRAGSKSTATSIWIYWENSTASTSGRTPDAIPLQARTEIAQLDRHNPSVLSSSDANRNTRGRGRVQPA